MTVSHDTSPAPATPAEGAGNMTHPPERLAAAARALGARSLTPYGLTFNRYWCTELERIGSDADLVNRLLDTLPLPQLGKDDAGWCCDSDWSEDFSPNGMGETKLTAVLACIHAMEAGND